MAQTIRIGAVNYLNTKPLLYGIQHHPIAKEIDLQLGYPALVADALKNNRIDVGLIPVAAIKHIPDANIISDYGIAADGAVASVGVFSQQPIDTLSHVYMDYQSRTSVKLAEILLKEYFKVTTKLKQADDKYIQNIKGAIGGVIIGDRALENSKSFAYNYDLAMAWKDYTDLPFVFAVWVANKVLPKEFEAKFNEANRLGIEHISEVVNQLNYEHYDLNHYYTKNICYLLDAEKEKGLALFLEKLSLYP